MFDLDKQISSYFDMITDANYGRRNFEQMAVRATPTLDTFLGMQAANGGSHVIANKQHEFARMQALDQANQAYSGFRLNTMGQAQNLLGLMSERNQFARELDWRGQQASLDRDLQRDQWQWQSGENAADRRYGARQASADRKASFWNNMIKGGIAIADMIVPG
jgi:hypothetical protein